MAALRPIPLTSENGVAIWRGIVTGYGLEVDVGVLQASDLNTAAIVYAPVTVGTGNPHAPNADFPGVPLLGDAVYNARLLLSGSAAADASAHLAILVTKHIPGFAGYPDINIEMDTVLTDTLVDSTDPSAPGQRILTYTGHIPPNALIVPCIRVKPYDKYMVPGRRKFQASHKFCLQRRATDMSAREDGRILNFEFQLAHIS